MVLKYKIHLLVTILTLTSNMYKCDETSNYIEIIETPWNNRKNEFSKISHKNNTNSDYIVKLMNVLKKFDINELDYINENDHVKYIEPHKFNVKEHYAELISLLKAKEIQEITLFTVMKRLVSEISQIKNIMNSANEIKGNNSYLRLQIDMKLNNLLTELKTITNNMLPITPAPMERTDAMPRKHREANRKVRTTRENLSELVYEFKRALRDKSSKCDCKSTRAYESFPGDCYEIMNLGFNVSGIYKIRPEDFDPFYVLCDMDSAGGGWTVFQNRYDGSQDFYKPWNEYKYGFGNLAGEFWLGLEKLHFLSNQKLYVLRVDMQSHTGEETFAGYSVFSIGSEIEHYRISAIGSYYGNAGDSLSYHSGQKFSTYDMDNDDWADGVCAEEHGGAWWYRECDRCNLNGKYVVKHDDDSRWQGIYWNTFKGPTNYLSRTRMMIRPLPISHTETETVSTQSTEAEPVKMDFNLKDHHTKYHTHKSHKGHEDAQNVKPINDKSWIKWNEDVTKIPPFY